MEIDFSKYPTPETDAMIKENGLSCKCADKPKELCRRLEQQKAALLDALENLTNAVGNSKVPKTIGDSFILIMITLGPALTSAREILTATKGNK